MVLGLGWWLCEGWWLCVKVGGCVCVKVGRLLCGVVFSFLFPHPFSTSLWFSFLFDICFFVVIGVGW